MNRVILLGRLTAKPELRYTNSNTAFLRFTVAVNRNFTGADGKREADFINDGNKRYTMDVALDNFEFVEGKNSKSQADNDSYNDPSPYDYQDSVSVENDPFAEYGDSVSIDDNFLD